MDGQIAPVRSFREHPVVFQALLGKSAAFALLVLEMADSLSQWFPFFQSISTRFGMRTIHEPDAVTVSRSEENQTLPVLRNTKIRRVI